MKDQVILEVKQLTTSFDTEAGLINALEDVSFTLKKGQTLGLVGESGCGKSVTALSIMRLLPKPVGQIRKGEVLYRGQDLLKVKPDDMYHIRGAKIAMIFQEPMTALNPVKRVGDQITEMFDIHNPEMDRDAKINAAVELLNRVGIPDALKRLYEYPHQLSGGMRQRVMIAMALSCEPDILIADEPTTALDVTIQAQILTLIKDLQAQTGMSIIFITHDLGVIAELCDHVVVMYAGNIAETAPVKDIFKNPKHPYTEGLLSSIPRLTDKRKVELQTIKGMVPSLYDLPHGCRFQNRCPHMMDICKNNNPGPYEINHHHFASCHLLDKKRSQNGK